MACERNKNYCIYDRKYNQITNQNAEQFTIISKINVIKNGLKIKVKLNINLLILLRIKNNSTKFILMI